MHYDSNIMLDMLPPSSRRPTALRMPSPRRSPKTCTCRHLQAPVRIWPCDSDPTGLHLPGATHGPVRDHPAPFCFKLLSTIHAIGRHSHRAEARTLRSPLLDMHKTTKDRSRPTIYPSPHVTNLHSVALYCLDQMKVFRASDLAQHDVPNLQSRNLYWLNRAQLA